MGRVVTSGKPTWCNGSTLAQNARDVGLVPLQAQYFPFSSHPQHKLKIISAYNIHKHTHFKNNQNYVSSIWDHFSNKNRSIEIFPKTNEPHYEHIHHQRIGLVLSGMSGGYGDKVVLDKHLLPRKAEWGTRNAEFKKEIKMLVHWLTPHCNSG